MITTGPGMCEAVQMKSTKVQTLGAHATTACTDDTSLLV